ncbi:hypothetical protein ACQKJC_18810 [Priestia koreensis]|uniref:hypothetical protein n=1 Tax=Priestia koreensis TaxID=284581 RepID=UPI003D08AE09
MLSFERKKTIFSSFTSLKEKEISNNRTNFVYPYSLRRAKVIATQLHPSGNGYLLGLYMDSEVISKRDYKVDERGWISIKNFSEEQLRVAIEDAIFSMSGEREMEPREEANLQLNTSAPVTRNLVEPCLYNWLGYGNLNAPIWFMGIEEGGAEVWRNKTKSLSESLEIRSHFQLEMDFVDIWENQYGLSLQDFRGPTVWRFMAAFLLTLESIPPTKEAINDYLFVSKKLGRKNSNHFLGEFMPLPKQSKLDISPYSEIWPTIQSYYNEVSFHRFELIKNTLLQNPRVRLLVSYDQSLTERMKKYANEMEEVKSWTYKTEQYYLYKWSFSGRDLYFLSTPFFGNGRIGYEGIQYAATKIKSILGGTLY